MWRVITLCVLCLLWIGNGLVWAEEAPEAAAPETASDTEAYRLHIGDVLGVVVLGETGYSGSYSVRADGSILFSDDMVGAVTVAGLSIEEATQTIATRIGEFIKDPSVTLTINRFKVMVVGEVRQPGQYDIDAGMRLSEAVTRAGGPLDERRDLSNVYVTTQTNQQIRYDLRAFREAGDDAQNPLLSPGDRISVGRERNASRVEFRISGAVKKPGYYPLDREREIKVTDAIESCGRWTEEANPRAAQLIRADGTKLIVDLVLLDGDATGTGNEALQEGDELFIPRNPVQVSVLGGVKKEGQYRVPVGTTVLEAIAVAGGLADTAILRGCVLMRNSPQPERIPIDLDKLMKKGDVSQNPILVDRDIIIVPARGRDTGRKSTLETVTENISRYFWLFRVW